MSENRSLKWYCLLSIILMLKFVGVGPIAFAAKSGLLDASPKDYGNSQ